MLGFFQIVINFIWFVLCINVPMTDVFHFTIWQFFLTIAIIAVTLKQLFKTADKGGKN